MAHRGAADPSVSPLLLLILLLLPQGSSEESRPRGATLLPKDRTALLPKVRAALLPKVRAALLPKDRAALLPKVRAALLPKVPADLLPKDRTALLPKVPAALLPKVRACPHGMFWSSEGCTHCNCDPSEVVRPQCDSDGRCKCSGRVLDSTCRSCPNGTLGPLASCQPCFCNGHSRACTSSGFCIDCGGNTTGPRCEHCLPGFYHPPGSLITMPCTKEECCPPWITQPSNSETPQTLQLIAAKKGTNKKSGRQFPAWDLPTVPPLMREGEVLHTTNLGPTNGISKIKSGVIKVFNNRTSQGMEAAQATMLSEVQSLSTMLITPFRGKVRMDKVKITTERAKWETIETSTAKGTAMALSISVQKHATNTTRENHAQKAQPSSKVNMDARLTTVERVKMTELEKALNATGRNSWATLATEGVPLIADGSVAEGMGLTTVGKEVEAVPITAGKVAKATAMTAAGRVMEGAASNAEGINVGAAPTAEGRMEVGTSPRVAGRSEVALATQGRVVMGVATTVPRREAGASSVGASTTTKGRMETRAAQTAEGESEVGAAPTTEARGEVGAGLTKEGRPTLTVKGRWEEALTTAKGAEVAMTIATMSTRLKIGPTLRVTSPSKHAKETSTSETSPTKSVLKTTTEFLTPPPTMLLPNGGCGELNQCSTDFFQSLSSPNATVSHGQEKHREPAVPATKEILTTDFKFNADEKLVANSMKNTSSNTALIDGLLNNFATRTAIGQGIHTTSVQTEQRSDSETNGFQPSLSDISSTSQTLEGWFREMTGMSRNAEFHRTVGMSTAHPVSMLMEPWTTASTVKTEIPTLQVITQTTSTMEQISVSQAPELSSQVNTGVVRKMMTATTSHSTIPPVQDTSPRSGFKHKTEVVTQPSFGRGQEIDNEKEDPLRGNDRPSMIVVSITVAAVAIVAVLGIGTFGIITFLRRRRRQKQSLPFWTIELKADATSLTSERDCLPHADASGLLEGAPDAEKRVGADIRLADSVEQSPTTHGWLFGCDTQASLIV